MEALRPCPTLHAAGNFCNCRRLPSLPPPARREGRRPGRNTNSFLISFHLRRQSIVEEEWRTDLLCYFLPNISRTGRNIGEGASEWGSTGSRNTNRSGGRALCVIFPLSGGRCAIHHLFCLSSALSRPAARCGGLGHTDPRDHSCGKMK